MPLVAIVSEALARKYWPDGSAVGRTMTMVSTNRRYEIVGVSADHKVRSVSEDATPYVHLAAAQRPATYNALLARTTGDAEVALAAIRRELLAMEPRLVFVNQGTMERTFAGTLLPARVGSMLAAGFGALGTALAAIGLYGVVAFAVSRRTREIGIRLALGAARGDVLRMILRQGATLVAAGAIAGAVLAGLASTVLASVLFGVSAAGSDRLDGGDRCARRRDVVRASRASPPRVANRPGRDVERQLALSVRFERPHFDLHVGAAVT